MKTAKQRKYTIKDVAHDFISFLQSAAHDIAEGQVMLEEGVGHDVFNKERMLKIECKGDEVYDDEDSMGDLIGDYTFGYAEPYGFTRDDLLLELALETGTIGEAAKRIIERL